ncbi:MAG: ABC transporter substrate-binding protein, partial [Halobacteriota archaeon]
VAQRVLTVPIMPAHEWEKRTGEVDLAEFKQFDGFTEAMVWENLEPVGSGFLQFERTTQDEKLVLRRFDDHFLYRENAEKIPSEFADGALFKEMHITVAPSSGSAIELVSDDKADATLSTIDPSEVSQVDKNGNLKLLVDKSESFYHVGINTRQEELSSPQFRRLLARLLDPSSIAMEVFDGYFDPAVTPIQDSSWTPSDLEWSGVNPVVPFIGSEGKLDDEAARNLFREAGYNYDEKGYLLR